MVPVPVPHLVHTSRIELPIQTDHTTLSTAAVSAAASPAGSSSLARYSTPVGALSCWYIIPCPKVMLHLSIIMLEGWSLLPSTTDWFILLLSESSGEVNLFLTVLSCSSLSDTTSPNIHMYTQTGHAPIGYP